MPLPLLALAFGGLSALSKVGSGIAQAKGLAAQAQSAKIEAEMAKIQGVQAAEIAQEQLRQTLGNIDAIRSARGVGLDSPTGQAIDAKVRSNAARDQAVTALGYLQRVSAGKAAARGYRQASKYAIPLAGLDALSGLGTSALTAFGK